MTSRQIEVAVIGLVAIPTVPVALLWIVEWLSRFLRWAGPSWVGEEESYIGALFVLFMGAFLTGVAVEEASRSDKAGSE